MNISKAKTPNRKAGVNRIDPPARLRPRETRVIEKGTEIKIVVIEKPIAEKGLIPATN